MNHYLRTPRVSNIATTNTVAVYTAYARRGEDGHLMS